MYLIDYRHPNKNQTKKLKKFSPALRGGESRIQKTLGGV